MQRYAALDSLRGLAALSVFLAHLHSIFWRHHTMVDLTPLFVLWAGGEAVILFFVLSGFVLTKSTLAVKSATYPQFLVGRGLRIGLPNLAMLACCVIAVMASSSSPTAQVPGFQWPRTLDPHLLTGHALMISDYNTMVLNDVVWPLCHEIRFALIFPVFVLVITRLRPAAALSIFAGLSLASAIDVTALGDPSSGFKTAYVYTLHYLLMFAMGGILMLNIEGLSKRLLAWSPASRWLCLVGALLVYCYARMLYLVPQKLGWSHVAVFNAFIADVMVAGAACVLMLMALFDPALKNWLEKKPLQYLGKVSFSLYLVHIPVLKICVQALPEATGLTIAAMAVPLVALATCAFHSGVELPAQQLGRSIIQRWSQPMMTTPQADA
jgi:peptidoglycan/LPS O-acetylase OafA/YrhL